MKSTSLGVVALTCAVAGMVLASSAAVHYRAVARRYQRLYLDVPAVSNPVTRDGVQASAVKDTSLPLSPPVSAGDGGEQDGRIEELEELVRIQESRIAALQGQRRMDRSSEDPDEAPEPRRDRTNWMEALRESDPDRYAEIAQRREAYQRRVQDSFARKAAHFLHRDVDQLSDTEREEHEILLGLLGETWQLSERLQESDLSREERSQLRRELMENARTLRPILEEERDREFYELGRQLGYDEGGAGEFVDYINDMLEITSFGSIGGRGGRRGGRE